MDGPHVGAFSEEQFRAACEELKQPALAEPDWQLLVESLGFSIFRRLDKVAAAPQEDRRSLQGRGSREWGGVGRNAGAVPGS